MTRRILVNSMVALPIAAAVPVAAAAMSLAPSAGTDRRALEAYASWLLMERRILCGELWPHMGAKAEDYDWFDNAGHGWHFHGDGDWRDLPQPASPPRAAPRSFGGVCRKTKPASGTTHEDTR